VTELDDVADGQDHSLDPRVIPMQRVTGGLFAAAVAIGTAIALGIVLTVGDDIPGWMRVLLPAAWLALAAFFAVLAYAWGLSELGRWGWAAGFLYVTAAAIRLARFNIQTGTQTDKRYFIGMPSPAAAGVPAATIFFHPWPLVGKFEAMAAIAVIVIPAILMVSTIRFRSFKTINLGWDAKPTPKLMVFAALIVFIATEPRVALVIIAYTYLASAFIGLALTYLRPRRLPPPEV